MKKILGIGNALVDIIYFLENDAVLEVFSLPKGSMQLVDDIKASKVEKAASVFEKFMASGGSAANTIHGLSKLGMETAFIGTVGNDQPGDFFMSDLIQCGITPLLSRSEVSTGRAITLVTPDGERTFATYLGAAVELSAERINSALFSGYDHLHLEGYLVPNRSLVERAFEIAHENGMTVSLDLASYNVVEANLDFLKKIIDQYKPVVFANEDEARSFTGTLDAHKALHYFADLCTTAVVKTGAKGSLIFHEGKNYTAEAIHVNCLDTTGAGDLYAAGYIYGYVNGLTPDKCGSIGSLLAGKVIEEAGAKICKTSWDYIGATLKCI